MTASAPPLSCVFSAGYDVHNPSFYEPPQVSYRPLNDSSVNAGNSETLDHGIEEESLPTRRSLLSRLRNVDDNESWRTFFDTYWRLLYNVARKSGLSDHHAQDVVQETVISVARKIPEFRYDPAKGSFKQWLLLICRRRIQDHFRRAYSASAAVEPGSDEHARVAANIPDPVSRPDTQIDEVWDQEWRDNIYRTALAKVRQRVNPKQYQVFDCCVLQNQRPAEVARMLGMNAAQVYLAKHRVSAAVKQAVKELEMELGSGSG